MTVFSRFFALLFLLCTASCSSVTKSSSQKDSPHTNRSRSQKYQNIIVVDAGHGGHDQGAQSTIYKYQEKHLTLATSLMLKDHLEKMGYRVLLTRKKDFYLSLQKRTQIANKKRNTVFVSIHFNAASNKKANGLEIFYYDSPSQSEKKRKLLSKALAESVLTSSIHYTKSGSRGVKKGNFFVIRQTNIPAILVEGGFLTNKEEMTRLKDPQYLNRLSWGIAKGLDHFLNTHISLL